MRHSLEHLFEYKRECAVDSAFRQRLTPSDGHTALVTDRRGSSTTIGISRSVQDR